MWKVRPSQNSRGRRLILSISLAGAGPSSKDQTLDFAPVRQTRSIQRQTDPLQDDVEIEPDEDDEDNEPHSILAQNSALKFLLAGGISGAGNLTPFEEVRDSKAFIVSRTCTAPFDRLKVFLITRPPHLGGCDIPSKPSPINIAVFKNAMARIYAEGGVLAFWTGNGISVAKIFPESAIKFFAYESSVCNPTIPYLYSNVTLSRNVPLQSIGIVLMTRVKSAERVDLFLGGLVESVVNSVSWHIVGYSCLI